MLDRISSNSVRTILLLLLADSNRYVRSAAAEALAATPLGERAGTVIDKLPPLLADSNRYVRSAAALFEPNPAATGDIHDGTRFPRRSQALRVQRDAYAASGGEAAVIYDNLRDELAVAKQRHRSGEGARPPEQPVSRDNDEMVHHGASQRRGRIGIGACKEKRRNHANIRHQGSSSHGSEATHVGSLRQLYRGSYRLQPTPLVIRGPLIIRGYTQSRRFCRRRG
jgi:hypothetical protein